MQVKSLCLTLEQSIASDSQCPPAFRMKCDWQEQRNVRKCNVMVLPLHFRNCRISQGYKCLESNAGEEEPLDNAIICITSNLTFIGHVKH